MHLTTQDLTPVYRNSVGIDRIMDTLMNQTQHANAGNYPPYNIVSVDEDHYIIEIAVSGFNQDDINITTNDGQLIVRGDQKSPESDVRYLFQGISNKKFKRSFNLADYVEVSDANLANGILVINLVRNVPDSLKPKEIKINDTGLREIE